MLRACHGQCHLMWGRVWNEAGGGQLWADKRLQCHDFDILEGRRARKQEHGSVATPWDALLFVALRVKTCALASTRREPRAT